jgi:hypothetical protein
MDTRIYVVWATGVKYPMSMERVLIYCCVLFKSCVELAQNALVASAVLLAFYSLKPGGYTMTQGPTGGPRAEEIQCRI